MTDWFVGQKVACIRNDFYWAGSFLQYIKVGGPFRSQPRVGAIYLIQDIGDNPFSGGLFLYLRGFGLRRGFASRAFRPVVDTKTDISLLERLLNPVTPKVKEFT